MSDSDRREKPRVRFEDPVNIHRVEPSHSGHIFEVKGHPIQVKARDIAENGLCLDLNAPVEPQTILKVNFEVKKKSVDVYARVVWVDRQRCGLRFIVLDRDCSKAIRDYVSSTAN